MPLYEYRCTKCGEEFERMQSVHKATEPIAGPKCGGVAQRLFSSFATNVPYSKMYFSGPRKVHPKPLEGGDSGVSTTQAQD